MNHVPGGWAFLLLALAAFRVTRLIGWDEITARLRERILIKRAGGVMDSVRPRNVTLQRERDNMLTKLIKCPWCMGWWVGLAWWGAWLVWPNGTLIAATPWALAALVGLAAKNLDP